MGSRRLVILTVIVFLLTGSLGTYLYIRLQSSGSTQQELNKEAIVTTQEVGMLDEEVLIKQVEWKPGDSYINVGAGGTFYIIKLVTDGEVIRDPIEIKTKEGEVLATAIFSIRGYYLDSEGKLQSIIFPQIIKFTDGRRYVVSQQRIVDWSEEEIEETILLSPEMLSIGERGHVVRALLIPDIQLLLDKSVRDNPGQEIPEVAGYYYSLIEKYNQSWKSELEQFYEKGDFFVDILFPSGVAFGQLEVVDLDSLGK